MFSGTRVNSPTCPKSSAIWVWPSKFCLALNGLTAQVEMFARRFSPVFLPTFTRKQSSLVLFSFAVTAPFPPQVLLTHFAESTLVAHSSAVVCFGRSELAVTAGPWGSSTPTGWAKTPPTSSSRWFWSTRSTKPSGATQTPSGSRSLCTSTERCAAWRLQERRAAAWARATSSTWPSEAPVAPPGRGATPCSCTATVRVHRLSVHSRNKHPFYGDWLVFCAGCFKTCSRRSKNAQKQKTDINASVWPEKIEPHIGFNL